MERAGKLLGAEEAWKRGIKGQGITAAVLDTGMALHPDFRERMVAFRNFVGSRQTPFDDYGHGTHVTGVLAGNGRIMSSYRGIAPETKIVHLKVLDSYGNGKREDVIAAVNWVLRNRVKYDIRIINISVGTVKEGNAKDTGLVEAVETAWDQGIVVVVAAGNMGPGAATITAPGNSRKVITVGCSDKEGPVYAGRGPTKNCVCKPDIVAPGWNITSCSHSFRETGMYYCKKSGTSMATPMVSGAVALLLSKEPWLTNLEVKMRLRETAEDLGLEHGRQGWGRLNIPLFLKV